MKKRNPIFIETSYGPVRGLAKEIVQRMEESHSDVIGGKEESFEDKTKAHRVCLTPEQKNVIYQRYISARINARKQNTFFRWGTFNEFVEMILHTAPVDYAPDRYQITYDKDIVKLDGYVEKSVRFKPVKLNGEVIRKIPRGKKAVKPQPDTQFPELHVPQDPVLREALSRKRDKELTAVFKKKLEAGEFRTTGLFSYEDVVKLCTLSAHLAVVMMAEEVDFSQDFPDLGLDSTTEQW